MPAPIVSKASSTPVRIVDPTGRPTPKSAKGAGFGSVLATARPVLRGVEAAASILPGGPLLTAVAKGVASGVGGGSSVSGASASGGGAEGERSMESVMADSQAFNLYYLQLQEEISAENRGYTALSNVLKARHDTVKNAIGNVR